MITVWGEGRGFRVVWLLEEMGLPYTLRGVDLMAGVENDPEFLAINPAGFIPALQDGEMTMVESIAIMEYLLTRYPGTSTAPLALKPGDVNYGKYLQFMVLGETGLSGTWYIYNNSHRLAPEAEQNNWGGRYALEIFESRLALVKKQLEQTPYLAGDTFTAADISVAYALLSANRSGKYTLDDQLMEYVLRIVARDGYKRTLAACPATRGWIANAGGL